VWPRIVELMLGVWLTLSPFIFRGTPRSMEYTINDAVSGALVIGFSLAAFWRPLRRANIGTIGIALWLTLYGYFSAPRPGPPGAQNDIVVGLLLLVFAILPTDTNRPPDRWRAGIRTAETDR
jgi:hypothetical protein